MSDDKVFRPERKRVNPSEFNEAENVPTMAATAFNDAPPTDLPLKISGNMPPQFQKMMDQQQPVSARGPQMRPQQSMQPYGTNEQFEQLVRLLKDRSGNFDKVVLPSLGKFYNGSDGPTDGVLHIRPMTGQEEQILATPRYHKGGQAINKILQGCIREMYDPDSYLTIDRTYLLIYLRGISYTQEYDIQVRCPECTKKYNTTLDLNSLMLEQCPEDFGPSSLQGTLPKSGFKFTYRLSCGRDDTMVQEHKERRMKEWGDAAADDTLMYRASLLVNSIEDVTGQHMIQQLLPRLPVADVNHIRNVVERPPFGVNTEIPLLCPMCMAEFDIDMPYELGFFFPRRKETQKNQP